MKKKFSTGGVIATWIIAMLLILCVVLGVQWYRLLTEDTTTQQYQRDTCIIVDADIIELYQHGIVVGYNGMRYNVPCGFRLARNLQGFYFFNLNFQNLTNVLLTNPCKNHAKNLA